MKLCILVLLMLLMCACVPTELCEPYAQTNSCQPFYYRINDNLYMALRSPKVSREYFQPIAWQSLSSVRANLVLLDVINSYIYSCPGRLTKYDVDNTFLDAFRYHSLKGLPAFKFWLAVRSK